MFRVTAGRTPKHSCANWNSRYAGAEAFTSLNKGYRVGSVRKVLYLAHRVAWAMSTGEWPKDEIDHINGIREDNRLENLRSVTPSENRRNQGRPKDNTSGVMGVGWHSQKSKWRAFITVDRRMQHLGLFDRFEMAVAVRKEAEKLLGYHANHGRGQSDNS